jgi:hypothetical protein
MFYTSRRWLQQGAPGLPSHNHIANPCWCWMENVRLSGLVQYITSQCSLTLTIPCSVATNSIPFQVGGVNTNSWLNRHCRSPMRIAAPIVAILGSQSVGREAETLIGRGDGTYDAL